MYLDTRRLCLCERSSHKERGTWDETEERNCSSKTLSTKQQTPKLEQGKHASSVADVGDDTVCISVNVNKLTEIYIF
jgi:hypothetical protein